MMKTAITREQAYALLRKYNQDPFHLRHGRTVEEVMRHFARELGYGEEEEFWGIVGLLHDLDFEKYPEQHCIKSQELMREAGLEEELIHATASHGYGQVCDIKPEHQMEKVLFACDEDAPARPSSRARRCWAGRWTSCWSARCRPCSRARKPSTPNLASGKEGSYGSARNPNQQRPHPKASLPRGAAGG